MFTKLTQLLGIHTPIVCPPMAGASGGSLAARVTLAGGFGFIAAAYADVEHLEAELASARALLSQSDPLDIGVGFFGWRLEQPASEQPASGALEQLHTALAHRVKAVWFSFGNALGQWVQLVRRHDEKAGPGNKTIVFVQVSSVEEALIAVNEWKVDCLVAQGIESGGHGYSAAPPLLTLLSSILSALPPEAPPILAAGGLANGSQVAAVLTLGASGAVLGTRFLLTPESLYTDAQKKMLLAAKANSTVRTMAFDQARGTLGWPSGVNGRAIWNSTVADYDKGADVQQLKRHFDEGVRNDDPDRLVVWAGTGVGLMSAIRSAEDVLCELDQEALERLKAAQSIVN